MATSSDFYIVFFPAKTDHLVAFSFSQNENVVMKSSGNHRVGFVALLVKLEILSYGN